MLRLMAITSLLRAPAIGGIRPARAKAVLQERRADRLEARDPDMVYDFAKGNAE